MAKPKAKQKETPPALSPARAAIVDELGALDAKLALLANDYKRREALKKKVREWPTADGTPAGATVAYSSGKYIAALGPRENERAITSLAAVHDRLGLAWLLAHGKVTLKDLEAAAVDCADLLTEGLTGPRPLTLAKA